MNLDKFDVKSILDTRKYLISNYFKEVRIENEEFSKYNFVVNPNFLFEKRDVYLYSLALTYGFSIAIEIYNNQTFSRTIEAFSNINSMDEIIQELFDTQLDNKHFYETQLNLLYEYCKFLFDQMIGSDDK